MKNYLLVHGAWGGAWEFKATLDGLRRLGHRAHAVDLPGHGQNNAPIPGVTMDTYVQTVIDEAEALTGPIVLVGHSLGGAIISQVAERIPDKIERLVYVAAILPQHGETPMDLMQSDADGQLLPRLEFSEDGTYVTVGPDAVKGVLLHDVHEPERLESFLPHFAMRQATAPFLFAAQLSQTRFGSVAKTYVRASLDKVLSTSLQDRMLSHWNVDQVLTLESGHFPLMSVPESLIESLNVAGGVPAHQA